MELKYQQWMTGKVQGIWGGEGGGWEKGDFEGRGLRVEENVGQEHTGGVWVRGI